MLIYVYLCDIVICRLQYIYNDGSRYDALS